MVRRGGRLEGKRYTSQAEEAGTACPSPLQPLSLGSQGNQGEARQARVWWKPSFQAEKRQGGLLDGKGSCLGSQN